MISAFIWDNAVVLTVAVPLMAAFLCPLIGMFSDTGRKIWVLAAATLTSALVLFTAWKVYTYGTWVYVFGATVPNLTVPSDSGGIPIRIMFEVDAMSALRTCQEARKGCATIDERERAKEIEAG